MFGFPSERITLHNGITNIQEHTDLNPEIRKGERYEQLGWLAPLHLIHK
jgi:hypothetical protein